MSPQFQVGVLAALALCFGLALLTDGREVVGRLATAMMGLLGLVALLIMAIRGLG